MGHFSPMKDESTTLSEGDVAKIDLGSHIDGYVS
jgi:methionine aminopeptidase